MKKLLFISGLLLLSVTAFAGVEEDGDDDEAKYQYYYACGEVHKADASLSMEEIAKLVNDKEDACEQAEDKEDVSNP